MPDLRRIDRYKLFNHREIRDCQKDKVNYFIIKESNVMVQPINDNLLHLKGTFKGPEGTGSCVFNTSLSRRPVCCGYTNT